MGESDETGGSIETWQIRKAAVQSRHGMVVSQHFEASQAGARVLAEGGNAVDAAVAAAVAIGTVEPFMSGLGGCGHMLVYLAAEKRAFDVDFGVVAPRALNPDDYALVSGTDSDLFGWPAVIDDRNVVGPYSVAVPGFVAGMAAALERFGTRSWRESLAVVRPQNGVYPALFACPNLVLRDENRGLNVGGAFVMSPWSKAVAAG